MCEGEGDIEEITVTSDQGDEPSSSAGCLGIVWVYPKPVVTPLANAPIVLGRGSGCTTELAGAEVSRRHVEVIRFGEGWVVRDLGSKNGTLLNGSRVTEAPISRQDVLRVGEWVGVVSRHERNEYPVRSIAPGIFGATALASQFARLRAIAPSNLAVVIVGETGTGKEAFAHELHVHSRRSGAFVAVNCAALPEQLAEGELFGYSKGAFTGATRNNPGHLRAADGGTVFLDEVVELEGRIQAKLLRALETRSVMPLGESVSESVDFRVIAAAQTPLAERVEAGTFRRDLYARLNGFEIELPPIRCRREEVLAHFRRALAERCGGTPLAFDADVAEQLCLYDWPLNVREIIQLASRIAVLNGHEASLTRAHLPRHLVRTERVPDWGNHQQRERRVSRAARRLRATEQRNQSDLDRLLVALDEVGGNVSAAAKALGISRQRAHRLLDQRSERGADRFAVS